MGESEGQRQAAEIQNQSAMHQLDLFSIGSPGMRLALDDFLKDLNRPGQEPESVKKAFSQMRGQTSQEFGYAEDQAGAGLRQQYMQSGYRGDPGALGEASSQVLMGLEGERRNALLNLRSQESDAALQQRDFDLSNILGISQGAISQSFGIGQQALGYAQMNNKNPWGGAASGAISGASMGGSVGGGWGALIGGVVGGAAGYFGNS